MNEPKEPQENPSPTNYKAWEKIQSTDRRVLIGKKQARKQRKEERKPR